MTSTTRRKRGRPAINPDIIARALALVEDGASVCEAARTIGISHTTLYRHTATRWTFREAGSLGRAVRRANAVREAGGSLANATRRAGAAGL